MTREKLFLALYPIKTSDLNDSQKKILFEIINNEVPDLKENYFHDLLLKITLKSELKNYTEDLKAADKKRIFNLAGTIVNKINLSKETLLKLADLGKELKADAKDSGVNFNVYNIKEINDYEFIKTVRNYSAVASIATFVPLPFSDFMLLTIIQAALIAKISNIYDYKIDYVDFLKLMAGTVGSALLFKTFSRLVYSLIPIIGWGVKAAIAYGGTYAIAILAKTYIEAKGVVTKENIKELWTESFEEGKKEFYVLKDYILKKKEELLKEFENIKKEYNSKAKN